MNCTDGLDYCFRAHRWSADTCGHPECRERGVRVVRVRGMYVTADRADPIHYHRSNSMSNQAQQQQSGQPQAGNVPPHIAAFHRLAAHVDGAGGATRGAAKPGIDFATMFQDVQTVLGVLTQVVQVIASNFPQQQQQQQ